MDHFDTPEQHESSMRPIDYQWHFNYSFLPLRFTPLSNTRSVRVLIQSLVVVVLDKDVVTKKGSCGS